MSTEPHVTITRHPVHGVVATGLDSAPYQTRRLLADYGFTPLPGSQDLALTGHTENLFLHARQTVAVLRGTGVKVTADEPFDYARHPGVARPSAVAAGPDTIVMSAPAAASLHDVAVGNHRQLGIVATNPGNDPKAAAVLAEAGFARTSTGLFAMDEPEHEGVKRATKAVSQLRAAGLRVAADLAYEPLTGTYASADPFATKLIQALDRDRGTSQPTAPIPAQAEDPFHTRLFKAPPPLETPSAKPTRAADGFEAAPSDPFGTRLHTAPATAGQREGTSRVSALLGNRADTLTAINRTLEDLGQQIRDRPESIDADQAAAVIGQAQSALGSVRRDLASVSAVVQSRPVTTTRSAPAGDRARAALATSTYLNQVTKRQPIPAATAPVDPRIEYARHR